MTRENQLILNDATDYYYCTPCQRHFRSRNGAIQHASTASTHCDKWCDNCEWLFVSPEALDSHLENSRQHSVCNENVGNSQDCTYNNRDHHYHCYKCGDNFPDEYSLLVHTHHQQYANQSHESEESTESGESDNYRNTYYPECRVCGRDFNKVADIVQHLEGSTCESGIDSDYIRETVLRFDHRGALTNYRDRTFPFRCPHCGENFRFVGGLLQHIQRGSCEQRMDSDIWDILDIIQDRLGWRW